MYKDGRSVLEAVENASNVEIMMLDRLFDLPPLSLRRRTHARRVCDCSRDDFSDFANA